MPPHVIIHGMAKHGFQLYFYGQDQRTLGGIKNARHTYKSFAARMLRVWVAAAPRL